MTTTNNRSTSIGVSQTPISSKQDSCGQISLSKQLQMSNTEQEATRDMNDAKRELSYNDYYGADPVTSPSQTKRRKVQMEPSCLPKSVSGDFSPSSDKSHRKSFPLDLLGNTLLNGLNLEDLPPEEWRRKAHISSMLMEATEIAEASLAAVQYDESEAKKSSLKRRNSFAAHRTPMDISTLPESAFHESLSDIGCPESTLGINLGSKEFDHRSLARPIHMPCWRKPVVDSVDKTEPQDKSTHS